MTRIFIDADACPVKDEVYRVAERYRTDVVVVANGYLKVPMSPLITLEVVPGSFDAADDWIVENVKADDVVVTADILLAQRGVAKRARVLDPKGREFTPDNVGDAVATRELMQNLRAAGQVRGGAAPMDKKDRSRFLGTLDQILQSIQRRHRL